MAISKKTGREYESRRERGYRPTKYDPKKYDRFGNLKVCGVIDTDGKECQNPTSSGYNCEYHRGEGVRQIEGQEQGRPRFEYLPARKIPKQKSRGSKKSGKKPVIDVKIDPTIQQEMTRERSVNRPY